MSFFFHYHVANSQEKIVYVREDNGPTGIQIYHSPLLAGYPSQMCPCPFTSLPAPSLPLPLSLALTLSLSTVPAPCGLCQEGVPPEVGRTLKGNHQTISSPQPPPFPTHGPKDFPLSYTLTSPQPLLVSQR